MLSLSVKRRNKCGKQDARCSFSYVEFEVPVEPIWRYQQVTVTRVWRVPMGGLDGGFVFSGHQCVAVC